jgi:hypothetical protein
MVGVGPKADIGLAKLRAQEVLSELKISEPPIDPLVIAARYEIDVKPFDNRGIDFTGCLVLVNRTFGILYSTAIPSLGFQRFTISHELGHYHLTYQHEYIFDRTGRHFSQGNFCSYQW